MGECVGLWKNNACGDCTGEMNQAVGKGKGCRAKCSQDKAPKENKKDNKDCVTECGDKKEFKKGATATDEGQCVDKSASTRWGWGAAAAASALAASLRA